MADGRITVGGSPATIDSLHASLKRLAEQKGVVWYYRERGQSAPPPQSAEVIQAVIQNRLPIKMSSRPDYSDAIGMDGRPITNHQRANRASELRPVVTSRYHSLTPKKAKWKAHGLH